MKIRRTDVYRYTLPLKEPLTLRGETFAEREGLLLRVESDTGAHGWGEAAPLPGFSTENCDQAEDVMLRCARIVHTHSHHHERTASKRTFVVWSGRPTGPNMIIFLRGLTASKSNRALEPF